MRLKAIGVVGTRYDGTLLTRVGWAPNPEVAPRVVQAFQMAAQGVDSWELKAVAVWNMTTDQGVGSDEGSRRTKSPSPAHPGPLGT